MKKYWKLASGLGFILSIGILLFSYLQFNGIGSFYMPSVVIFLLHLLFYLLAVYLYRKRNSGYTSFTDAFLLCTILTIVASVISTPLSFAYASTMSSANKNKVLDGMIEKSLYDNYFDESDELVKEDQLRHAFESMFDPGLSAVFSAIGTTLFMLVIAIIVALIMRRDPPIVPD